MSLLRGRVVTTANPLLQFPNSVWSRRLLNISGKSLVWREAKKREKLLRSRARPDRAMTALTPAVASSPGPVLPEERPGPDSHTAAKKRDSRAVEPCGEKQTLRAEEDLVAETQEGPRRKARRTRVGFDRVEIYEHTECLVNDRVPSSGGPSIGLGKLGTVRIHRVNSYDERRVPERVGVRVIDAAERRAALYILHRSASVDAVEAQGQEVLRQREETNQEAPSPTCFPPPALPDPPRDLGMQLPKKEEEFDQDEIGLTDLWT